jgi:hypothetical protein
MKKFIFIVLLFLLASCNDTSVNSRKGVDGYTFGEPSFEKNRVTITIVTYSSRKELLEAAKKTGINNRDLAAFALIPADSNNNTCTVHIMSPKVSYEPEWYGHEFMHCFYGQWHTSNNHRE